ITDFPDLGKPLGVSSFATHHLELDRVGLGLEREAAALPNDLHRVHLGDFRWHGGCRVEVNWGYRPLGRNLLHFGHPTFTTFNVPDEVPVFITREKPS